MSFKYFSKNGHLLPADQAMVPLSNIEYAYGFGVYETIRVSKGVIYFLDEHCERLLTSAQIIGLAHTFSWSRLQASVTELVAQTDAETYNLKMLLIGAKEAEDATLYIQCLQPYFPDRKLYTQGAVCTTHRHERLLPHAKSLNMLPSYLAYREARLAEAYDALLVNRRGNITEGTRTNFFCLQGRTIVSPPESEILSGVTRKHVVDVAQHNGFEIAERDISLNTVGRYDAAFITSTSSKIVPLRAIDGIQWAEPVPEQLRKLMQAFEKYLSDYAKLAEL